MLQSRLAERAAEKVDVKAARRAQNVVDVKVPLSLAHDSDTDQDTRSGTPDPDEDSGPGEDAEPSAGLKRKETPEERMARIEALMEEDSQQGTTDYDDDKNDDRDDDNDVTGPGPSTSSSRHASMPMSGPQNIMGLSRLVVPEPEESSVLARVSLHAMLLHFTTPSLQRVLAVSGAMLDYTRFQSSRRMRPQVSPARDPRAWWRHAIACILLERRRALLETHAVSESFTETRGGTSLALDHLALTFMPERKASYSALYERYLQARAAQNSRPVTFRRVAAELQASERKLPIQDILTWRWLVWVRLEDTKATPGIMHRMRQVWSKMTSMFVTSTST